MKKAILSLQKGLDILCSFDFDRDALSAQAISERLEIPLSTTYRYIQTLEEKGFLARDPDSRKYKLGLMLLQVGNIVASQMRFVDLIMPHMKSLSSLSGETVLLTVLRGWESVCIEKIEAPRLIKLSLETGSSLALHAGASSKILLAYQKDSFIDSMLQKTVLTRFTDNTITDPIALKKELETIREKGFAFSDHEVDLGVRAISAPVFDHKARLVAGLTVAGPSERMRNKNIPQLVQAVKESAQRASYALGYREPR